MTDEQAHYSVDLNSGIEQISNISSVIEPNHSRSYYESLVEKSMNLNGTLSFLEATFLSDQGPAFSSEVDSSYKRWKVAEPIALADGSVYEGELLEGMKDGKGRIKWPDGSKYEGEWQRD